MVDLVFAEVEPPEEGVDWQTGMRRRAASMRAALRRHPWATGLMDSRLNAGPATLRHHDAVLGCLRRGGFTVAGAAHAFSLIDSYVYGFAVQEHALPFDSGDDLEPVVGEMMGQAPPEEFAERFPYLTEIAVEHALKPGYDYGAEFAIGLELIVEGLERRRGEW
jgi:hypothetical protein